MTSQRLDLEPGKWVDYHRGEGPKDRSKRLVPCTVIDTQNIERGHITIRHMHRQIVALVQDVRRHMDFFVFLAAERFVYGSIVSAWNRVKRTIEQLTPGTSVTIAAACTSSKN